MTRLNLFQKHKFEGKKEVKLERRESRHGKPHLEASSRKGITSPHMMFDSENEMEGVCVRDIQEIQKALQVTG